MISGDHTVGFTAPRFAIEPTALSPAADGCPSASRLLLAWRNHVGEAILHDNLGNESVLFDHFEEQLWAASYESIRMAPEPGR